MQDGGSLPSYIAPFGTSLGVNPLPSCCGLVHIEVFNFSSKFVCDDFVFLWHQILKQKKTNYVANKNNEGEDVKIIFQGAGIRWPEQLERPEHPVHGLYNEVKDHLNPYITNIPTTLVMELTQIDLSSQVKNSMNGYRYISKVVVNNFKKSSVIDILRNIANDVSATLQRAISFAGFQPRLFLMRHSLQVRGVERGIVVEYQVNEL